MAKGWWHEGTVNGHYVLHQRVHVPAAAIDISPKEAYVGEGVSHFQVIQAHTSPALKPRQLELGHSCCSSAMDKQGLPAHLKALLKNGSRSNSANMLLAKPRPNILTQTQTDDSKTCLLLQNTKTINYKLYDSNTAAFSDS